MQIKVVDQKKKQFRWSMELDEELVHLLQANKAKMEFQNLDCVIGIVEPTPMSLDTKWRSCIEIGIYLSLVLSV